LAAAGLLLSHSVGAPPTVCHPDLVDGNEWDVRRQNPSPDGISVDLQRLPWGFAFSLSDTMTEVFQYQFANQNFYGLGGGPALRQVGEDMGDSRFAEWAEAHARELLEDQLYRAKQASKEERQPAKQEKNP
jgi:hypothetical protein